MEHLGMLLAKEKIVLRFHMDDGSGNHSLRPLSLLSFSGPLSLLKQGPPGDSLFKKKAQENEIDTEGEEEQNEIKTIGFWVIFLHSFCLNPFSFITTYFHVY
jgi:hypothetical protein